jgi:hypothetical protein
MPKYAPSALLTPLAFPIPMLVLLSIGTACSKQQSTAPRGIPAPSQPIAATTDDSWLGIYSSPSEIGGFSGTVLAIEKDYKGSLAHRMTFHSDVVGGDMIKEREKSGEVLTDGDKLYVATAFGFMHDGKPSLGADLTRYTRLQIQGRTVLLRDDALQEYQQHNRLYDYGVLIKVSDTVDTLSKLEDAKHESIKTLYIDPSKKWNDPFVNGPNER